MRCGSRANCWLPSCSMVLRRPLWAAAPTLAAQAASGPEAGHVRHEYQQLVGLKIKPVESGTNRPPLSFMNVVGISKRRRRAP